MTVLMAKYPQFQNSNSLVYRSYLQYRAQCTLINKFVTLLFNVICALVFPLFLALACLSGFLKKRSHGFEDSSRKPGAVFYEPNFEVMTKRLLNTYVISLSQKGFALDFTDIKFIFSIFYRFPFSYYFLTKIAYKISIYRFNQLAFRPVAMICASEYSFTSSISTLWCETNQLKHINIMHGEKLFHIMDSFSTFHEFNVWDTYYLDLLKRLNCSSEHFVIELPASFKEFQDMPAPSGQQKLCVFLQSPDVKSWESLASLFKPVANLVKIRPHPRWFKHPQINAIFKEFEIEDPHQVGIRECIKNSFAVCSLYSTVMLQGSLARRTVIIDNVSNPDFYETLKNLDVGVFARPHVLLSEVDIQDVFARQKRLEVTSP